MLRPSLLVLASACFSCADSHGYLSLPPSRNGGSSSTGRNCTKGECYWFTNNIKTSVAPSLPDYARTIEPNITGGPEDVYNISPWRAPGRAPVLGSGCGVGNGGPDWFWNSEAQYSHVVQGIDGLTLPEMPAQVWTRGSEVEVAWAISANHGGGYSYRLCPKSSKINEECFQRNVLGFAGEKSWIVHLDGSREAFMRTTVISGTYPVGSEWARNPIPTCRLCPTYGTCGSPIDPGTPPGSKEWKDWNTCTLRCAGSGFNTLPSCPAGGTTQFPMPGFSSFGNATWSWSDWSIMDRVVVPASLEPGDYLLSWRWDCEETFQVWQNCADIKIIDSPSAVDLLV